MSYKQVKINVPVAHQFIPSAAPSSVVLYGPSLDKSKASNSYGYVAAGSGGGYSYSFLPDELGTWGLIVKDSGGATVHSYVFDCVAALPKEQSMRLTNKYRGLVEIYPDFFVRKNYAIQITSITRSGTTATVTTASAHSISSATEITIYGVGTSGYNGTWNTVSWPTSTTFTITVPDTLTTPAVAVTGSSMYMFRTAAQGGSINNTGNRYGTFISEGKCCVPYTGYIYGIKLRAAATITSMTSVRFCTFTNDGNYTVRGISENFVATTPVEGSWTGRFVTIYFKNPVPAQVGDLWGIDVDANGFASTAHISWSTVFSYPAQTQDLFYRTSNSTALSLTSTNVFVTYGGAKGVPDVRLLMEPPAIALAGHSFYSGFADDESDTVSIYDYNTQNDNSPFVASRDIAAMIELELGVPVVNCAVGGSKLGQWVGMPTLSGYNADDTGAGWLEWNVSGLRPSVMLFDSVYNDANPSATYTNAEYRVLLDRLLWHCDKYGIELVMIEASPSLSATTDDRNANMERLRKVVRVWCQQNGIALIPMYYRMGQNGSLSGEESWERWIQKNTDPGLYLPDYQGGSSAAQTIHWRQAGRVAAANALSIGVRLRQQPVTLFATDSTADEALVETGARYSSDTNLAAAKTVVDAIKTKTDNLPTNTNTRFTSLDTAVAALPTSIIPFAVPGLHWRLDGTNEDYISLIDDDDKYVSIYYVDGSKNPVSIPSSATAAMLDTAGTATGTATVSDSKSEVGYLKIRLQNNGANRPDKLRITFAGGNGGNYATDIPIRSWG